MNTTNYEDIFDDKNYSVEEINALINESEEDEYGDFSRGLFKLADPKLRASAKYKNAGFIGKAQLRGQESAREAEKKELKREEMRKFIDGGRKSHKMKKLGYTVAGAGAGYVGGSLATKKMVRRISEIASKPQKTEQDLKELKKLKAKVAAIKAGSSVGGAIVGNIAAGKYNEERRAQRMAKAFKKYKV